MTRTLRITEFFAQDDGAVTVDFIALTGGIMFFGMMMFMSLADVILGATVTTESLLSGDTLFSIAAGTDS